MNQWEDEDHGTNDVAELRRMFRDRIYGAPMTDTTNHAAKDPATILREAIFICGDCPECGSDNWTDTGEHGECHSCGAKFSPTIPRQMLMASKALDALTRDLEAKNACPVCTDFERRYENLLLVHGKTVAENAAQSERIAKLEAVMEDCDAFLTVMPQTLNATPTGRYWQDLLIQVRAALAPKEAQG